MKLNLLKTSLLSNLRTYNWGGATMCHLVKRAANQASRGWSRGQEGWEMDIILQENDEASGHPRRAVGMLLG